MNQRLMVYRRIASARWEEEIDKVVSEVRDRYGPIPPSILNLADYGRIRVMADRLGIEAIDREGEKVVFRFRPQTALDPAMLVQLVQRRPDVTLVPPSGVRLDMKHGAEPRRPQPGQQAGRKAQIDASPWANTGQKPVSSTDFLRRRPGGRDETAAPASWWTTRATAGEVTAGFSKAEILKADPQDPRGASGVFTRVGGLLSDLLG